MLLKSHFHPAKRIVRIFSHYKSQACIMAITRSYLSERTCLHRRGYLGTGTNTCPTTQALALADGLGRAHRFGKQERANDRGNTNCRTLKRWQQSSDGLLVKRTQLSCYCLSAAAQFELYLRNFIIKKSRYQIGCKLQNILVRLNIQLYATVYNQLIITQRLIVII